jgi:SAM-dependent methyltransferase
MESVPKPSSVEPSAGSCPKSALTSAGGTQRVVAGKTVGTLQGSLRLLLSFKFERRDPDRFYRQLAENTVALIGQFSRLSGARVVDVGGGPGDLAEAFRAVGAEAISVDVDWNELHCRPRGLEAAVQADGRRLPIAEDAVDIGCLSNVLEHVSSPLELVEELIRVVRPGGIVFLNFTTWLSPFGGHETSPWHLLGASRAQVRYTAKHGKPPKNILGVNLFKLDVGEFLRSLSQIDGVLVVDAFPRYLPRWTRFIVRVPGLREVATLNLAAVLCKGREVADARLDAKG